MPGNIYSIIIDRTFLEKVANFPDEVYNFNPHDNLTNLMSTLLGAAGTGQLSIVQTAATNTQNLNGIEYSDLDLTSSSYLGVDRLTTEQYNSQVNPFIDQLDPAIWDQIHTVDSSFRERLMLILTAIYSGATILGLTLLAESVLNTKVRILERWRYPTSSDQLKYFKTACNTEFVVIPLGDAPITQDMAESVIDMMGLLKPINAIASIFTGSRTDTLASSFSSGATTIYDSSIKSIDIGAFVSGVGIADNTIITSVSPGVSFTISNPTTGSSSNSIVIYETSYETPVSIKQTVADSEWFELDKTVSTGSNAPNVNIDNIDNFPDRYWLDPSLPKVAPKFANKATQEQEIDLISNISNVTAYVNDIPTNYNNTDRNVVEYNELGPWTPILLADSPDNYPNGKYPGDINHYNVISTKYTGSNSAISSLTTLPISSVVDLISLPLPSSGYFTGSVITNNNISHSFTFTGVTQDSGSGVITGNLTGCVFDQSSDILLNGSDISVITSYCYEWTSQAEYVAYFTKLVTAANGQINSDGTYYRIALNNTYTTFTPISPKMILAPLKVRIDATTYGGI
jgi:hypothetical protein